MCVSVSACEKKSCVTRRARKRETTTAGKFTTVHGHGFSARVKILARSLRFGSPAKAVAPRIFAARACSVA